MTKDVIFDFDGVIADTRDMLFDIFQTYAHGVTDEDFDAHFDGNVYETPRITFTRDAATRMHEDYCERLHVDLLHDAIDPIRRLQKDYRMFIISSGDERGINRVLEAAGIAETFVSVQGHNTDKSKVVKFKRVRDHYGVDLAKAVFVTDTLGDLREAQNVGVRAIAETFGFHDRARLQIGEPHVIVDTWGQLEAEIHRLHGL